MCCPLLKIESHMAKFVFLLCIAMSFAIAMKVLKITNPLNLFVKTHSIRLDNQSQLAFKYNKKTKLLKWSLSKSVQISQSTTRDYILLVDDIRLLDKAGIKVSPKYDKNFVFYSKNEVLEPLDNKKSAQGDLVDNLLVAHNYNKSMGVKDLMWVTKGRPVLGEVDPLKFFQIASVAAQSSIKIHTIAIGLHANFEMLKKVSQISDARWLRGDKTISEVFQSELSSQIKLCTKGQIDCIDLQNDLDSVVNIEKLNIQDRKVYSELRIVTSKGAKTFLLGS